MTDGNINDQNSGNTPDLERSHELAGQLYIFFFASNILVHLVLLIRQQITSVKLNCIKRSRRLKHKIGREKAFQQKMGMNKELNGVKARSFYAGLCRRIWFSKKELASDLKLGHL